jgi:hypothetical protein
LPNCRIAGFIADCQIADCRLIADLLTSGQSVIGLESAIGQSVNRQ